MQKIVTFILLLLCNKFLTAQELKPILNFATAQKVMEGCIASADSSKLNMAIAIYDTQGN